MNPAWSPGSIGSRQQIKPDFVTKGGHYRWDVERIRREAREHLSGESDSETDS